MERTVSGNYFFPVIVFGEGDSVCEYKQIWKEIDEIHIPMLVCLCGSCT